MDRSIFFFIFAFNLYVWSFYPHCSKEYCSSINERSACYSIAKNSKNGLPSLDQIWSNGTELTVDFNEDIFSWKENHRVYQSIIIFPHYISLRQNTRNTITKTTVHISRQFFPSLIDIDFIFILFLPATVSARNLARFDHEHHRVQKLRI